ncbi:hypothetical protein M0L20_17965 [Spirosoma sp. RP8]|uniref:Glycosyltransferase family 2 protein n=1 Tax=Spirosoma liriopis TaxID=2937440 RepID=A0ABT0HNL9_9BACT|nr:hypothetical protein [Spirosoma liriopis]MCK8493758.1 hypothetical protein [Spirosoma liriopis]
MKNFIKRTLPSIHREYLTQRYGINRLAVEKKLSSLTERGVEESQHKVIVSLTSYGDRINDIHLTIFSLLVQTYKPNRILLWLTANEYPNRELDLPDSLLSLKNLGLEVKWCNDYKSYNKLIPALLEFPEYTIVTADDDVFYAKDWLKKLFDSYVEFPHYIHTHKASKVRHLKNSSFDRYTNWEDALPGSVSYKNFLKGVSGVLYPPRSLHIDATRSDIFLSLSPYADDVWFWSMAVLNKVKVKVIKDNISSHRYTNVGRELGGLSKTLHEINVQGGRNDSQLMNVLLYYPQINNILLAEYQI